MSSLIQNDEFENEDLHQSQQQNVMKKQKKRLMRRDQRVINDSQSEEDLNKEQQQNLMESANHNMEKTAKIQKQMNSQDGQNDTDLQKGAIQDQIETASSTKKIFKNLNNSIQKQSGNDVEFSDDEQPKKKLQRIKRLIQKSNSIDQKSNLSGDNNQNESEDVVMSGDNYKGKRNLRRRQKSKEEYQIDSEDNQSVQNNSQQDNESDFKVGNDKKQKLRQRIKKNVNMQKDFELDSMSSGSEKKVKAKKNQEKKRKGKKDLIDIEGLNEKLNKVKTQNKLIGEIVNNDLYASDEQIYTNGQDNQYMQFRGQDIEFNQNKKQTGAIQTQFLQKIKNKREIEEKQMTVEQNIINLGFIQNEQKLSANQLAANGIQISLKDKIVEYINQIDRDQSKEHKITNLEQNDSAQLNSVNSNKIISSEQNQFPIQQNSSILENSKNNEAAIMFLKDGSKEQSEDEGLEFYDPLQELKAKKEKEIQEFQRAQQLKLKEAISVLPLNKAASVIITTQQQLIGQQPANNHRQNFLQQLKNQQLQKKSRNVTIETVKQTFQQTDLNVDQEQKVIKAIGADGKEVELNDNSVDDDSEYQPSEHNKEDKNMEVWDEEENFIPADQMDNQEEGEFEVESNQINSKQSVIQQSQKSVHYDDKDDQPKRLRKLRKNSEDEDQIEKKSVESSFGASQILRKKPINYVIDRKKNTNLGKFFEDEAELGSDDENKDEMRKQIDKNDLEENEEGLDNDLDGFIDYTGDNKLIGDPDDAAYQKFQQDMQQDELRKTKIAMEAAIYGINKKRNRNQIDGIEYEDSEDEIEKKKRERIQERMELLNSADEEEMDNLAEQLKEGGKQRALQAIKLKQMAEEEELSEDELRQQIETSKYFQFIKQKQKNIVDHRKQMEEREKQMEMDLQNELNDLQDQSAQKLNNQNQIMNQIPATSKFNLDQVKTGPSIAPQKFTQGFMLNQKKVMGGNTEMDKQIFQQGKKASLFNQNQQNQQQEEEKQKKQSYSGVTSSMQRFFKNGGSNNLNLQKSQIPNIMGRHVNVNQNNQQKTAFFKQRKDK